MHHCGTQRLETPRLILRRFEVEDAAAMYRNWASDADVTKFLTWTPHPNEEVSRALLSDWVSRYTDCRYYHWAIVPKDGETEPIGSIAVMEIKELTASAHVGYCIGKAWWHQGIAAEALKAVMDFLFDLVGAERIEARHDPRNPNSGRVMQKCGMRYEGTLRRSDWNNQGICDACYYALLKLER